MSDVKWYRISKVENEIGAGLIEEVIQVAEGELKLVDVMLKNKVYVSMHPEPIMPSTDRLPGGMSSSRSLPRASGLTSSGSEQALYTNCTFAFREHGDSDSPWR